MKRPIVIFLLAQILAYAGFALAYEIPTHRQLSIQAFNKSRLKTDSSVLVNLGLDPSPEQKYPEFSILNERTISQLIEDGAAFEDNDIRVINHFYDPVNDRPLTDLSLLGFLSFIPGKSPDWALEDKGPFLLQNSSYRDARLSLLQALTESSWDDRRLHFGLTFETLGQVIHHLQDMAQPQHVRNEQHLIPPSVYEHSSNEKEILEQIETGYFSGRVFDYPKVSFDTPRKFWVTNEDGTRETGRGTGQGIAEFSVNNFVTVRRNFTLLRSSDRDANAPPLASEIFPHPEFPRPNWVGVQILPEEIGDPELGHLVIEPLPPFLNIDPGPLAGKLYFVGTPVIDTYSPHSSTFNAKTSTFSVYDAELIRYNLKVPLYDAGAIPLAETQAIFTLNRFNYEAARDLLLPRAISYSAGLIDYFFRGKVEMCDGENSDQSIIKNLSQTEDMQGVFALYYDDETGMRHQIAEWRTTDPSMLPEEANGELAKNGGEMRVTFLPPAPKPAKYLLVFYGDMGEEKAPRDAEGNILPGGAVVAKQIDTTKHCKGILWAINAHPSQTGTMTAYHLPDGRPLETVPLPPDTVGIAYDPRDGNLWYTVLTSPPSTNLGKIFKMAPNGTLLPEEITVQGTERRSDGSVQTDLAALDVDPDDPAYLWVTGAFSPTNTNHYLVYRVRVSDGQVVHRCHVSIPEGPSVGGFNGVLAVAKQGEGTVFLVAPNFGGYRQPLQAFEAYTCSPIFSAELFPDNSSQHFGAFIWSIEASRDNLLVSARKTDRTLGIYLGAPPYTPEGILLPGTSVGRDLAVGSSF